MNIYTSMRYVKTFELFGVYDDTLHPEVEDILRELEDDGIRVDVNSFDGLNVYLTNSKSTPFGVTGGFTTPVVFPYSKIKPNIEHLLAFLKDSGYILDTMYNIIDLSPTSLEYKDLQDDTSIGRLELNFKKAPSDLSKYIKSLSEKVDTSVMDKDIFDIWYILCDIIDENVFYVSVITTNSVINFNPLADTDNRFGYKSADDGCPFRLAKHGTSPEFFEYVFKKKVNNKQGFIIHIVPKDHKLFKSTRISDSLLQIKGILEHNNLNCEFYKDIISEGTGLNNKTPIDIESSNPFVYRLSIVVKP